MPTDTPTLPPVGSLWEKDGERRFVTRVGVLYEWCVHIYNIKPGDHEPSWKSRHEWAEWAANARRIDEH